MTDDEFMRLLTESGALALAFARRYVSDELPDSIRYHVRLNQSCDDNATVDERTYPEDNGKEYTSLSAAAVTALLVRDCRCPAWIDASVEARAHDHTRVRLRCCGRYTDDVTRMYYTHGGTGPFGIKSPDLPPSYLDGTKFRIPKIQPED